jgi:hypothetical protein
MIIVNENNDSVLLHNISTPVPSTHFWVLDLVLMDFNLIPLNMLEEQWCKCVAIEIEGFCFSVPATWHVLITDEDTSILDTIEAENLSNHNFDLVVYDNDKSFGYCSPVRIIDSSADECVVYPSLNRHQMMCHPISPSRWIAIAPNDGYNKYFKDKLLGDIL